MHFNTHAIRKIYPKFHNSSDKEIYFAKAWTFLNDSQIMFAQNMLNIFCRYLGKSWHKFIYMYNVHGYRITQNRTLSAISEIDSSLINFLCDY